MQQTTRIDSEETGPWHLVRDLFLNRVKWRTQISRSEFVNYDTLLAAHSEFYRGLSPDMKAKTMNRVVAFITQKKFVGHGVDVTTKMKVIIAFAAVKLTFGFEHYSIPLLHTIHVATGVFYAPLIKSHAKGLTSENGTMYLSWDNVREGIEDEKDGLHLAVHEMAHALQIDTVKGSPAKERFAFYLNTWMKEAKLRMKDKDNSFIRAYGKTNMHEFFAVCLENFIERPDTFYQEEPLLFAHTCYLLNQFPLEPRNRELNEAAVASLIKHTGAKFPKASAKDYTHHSWHWSFTILIVSIFVSPIFIIVLTMDVKMPIDGFAFWLLFCLLAAALFYKPVVTYKAMKLQPFFLFLIFGAGPALYSVGLLADFTIPIRTWEESYKVIKAHPNLQRGDVWMELENDGLWEWPEAKRFDISIMQQYRKNPDLRLKVKFKLGIMGIVRLDDRSFVKEHAWSETRE